MILTGSKNRTEQAEVIFKSFSRQILMVSTHHYAYYFPSLILMTVSTILVQKGPDGISKGGRHGMRECGQSKTARSVA